MKRFSSLIISIILLLLTIPTAFAEGVSDAVPAPEPYAGFEDLGSTRAALFDIDTGAVIFSNNADEAARPGSLTVIMTALLLCENTAPGEWDSPTPALRDVGSRWSRRGSVMGLAEGDTPTRRDLLYGLLLEGAADAATITGDILYGSEQDFISAMNARALELGMTNTHFDNGFGLGSNNHYSCATDLAKLTHEAMKQDMFASGVSVQSFTCSQGARGILLENTNSALASSNCIGIKSGEDSEKEHCVIVGSDAGGARLAAVILDAPSENAAYSFADRLISVGLTRYISGTGLYPFAPSNALIEAIADSPLSREPGGAAIENVKNGDTLRAVGYSEGYICVYRRGQYEWISESAVSLCCYVDDVFIENGESLSREMNKGEPLPVNVNASSRHEITRMELTLTLLDGSIVTRTEYAPCSHGSVDASGTALERSVSALTIPDGLYICTVTVEAEARLSGFEPKTITKRNRSLLAVGTGGECVSFNANMGDNAPDGECFFGAFNINSVTPERMGHVFSHWNTSPDGTGESFRPGDQVVSDSSLTLYAIWRAGEDSWDTELRAGYEGCLSLEGYIKNTAGVTKLRLTVGDGLEFKRDCASNTVSPGEAFLEEPIVLSTGEYDIAVYGTSAGGTETLLYSGHISVENGADITNAPDDTLSPASTDEPAQEKDPFSLAGLPIWIWFLIGLIVVIVLIAIIVRILKNG